MSISATISIMSVHDLSPAPSHRANGTTWRDVPPLRPMPSFAGVQSHSNISRIDGTWGSQKFGSQQVTPCPTPPHEGCWVLRRGAVMRLSGTVSPPLPSRWLREAKLMEKHPRDTASSAAQLCWGKGEKKAARAKQTINKSWRSGRQQPQGLFEAVREAGACGMWRLVPLCSLKNPGIPNSPSPGGSTGEEHVGLPCLAAETSNESGMQTVRRGEGEEEGQKMASEVPKRSAHPSGWRNRGRKHWCSPCTTRQGQREGDEREVLQEWAQSCSRMRSGGMEPPLGHPEPPGMGTFRCVQRDEGRAEGKETDGQRRKHKLTRRKRINSRHGADPSTYAAPHTAKHREAPAVPISQLLQPGPVMPAMGAQWPRGVGERKSQSWTERCCWCWADAGDHVLGANEPQALQSR